MNKKVVFLVVLLECILAVFLVSFFGGMIEDSHAQILCKDVYFTTESGERIEEELVEYQISDSNRSYKLYWKLEAKDVTQKEVTFISSKPEKVFVDESGLVTFIEITDVTITICVTDGSGKTDSITLVPKRGGGVIE
ncbi:MAG: Ig-like domain-containing protein [Clostridia bacterium]|nr:Ig-like domain-containing protein [Clostridia bacterium]